MKTKYIGRRKSSCMLACLLTFFLSIVSCKKLDVGPPLNSTNSANVFQDDSFAISAVTNLYVNIVSNGLSQDLLSTSYFQGLSADELTLANVSQTQQAPKLYYTNTLNSTTGDFVWSQSYNQIYKANTALEGLTNSKTLTPAVKTQLIGEVEFTRALYYFYLVNLYGDVPLALHSDYKVNSSLPRSPKLQVYQQIVNDLVDAQNNLSSIYPNGTLLAPSTERERPSKWVATALLARVYLYLGDLSKDQSYYKKAEEQASILINNTALFSLSSLDNAFLKYSLGNNEAIWQLQPTDGSYNSYEAPFFNILTTAGPNPNHPVYLSDLLLNSFESGDQRRYNGHWIDSVITAGVTYYFPNKYKVYQLNQPVTEYEMVFRLGEQYLIRAEARAQQGDLSGAATDLNLIRTRAGLANTAAVTQNDLLTAIMHERQVELFTEWGHRWLDLKRTGQVDAIMTVVAPKKGGTWKTTSQYYPIPYNDIKYDPNLTQNAGY